MSHPIQIGLSSILGPGVDRHFSRRAAMGIGVLLLSTPLTGCYTTAHSVRVVPLNTPYPVSASGQYVDSQGAIVVEDEYEVVEPFEFEKTFEAPRHETTESKFDLEPELSPLVEKSHGDAITDLKIAGYEYDPGSHGSSASLKIGGWMFGITGGALVVTGLALDDEDLTGTFVTAGAVVAGIGGLFYVFGALADDPSQWKYKVDGNVTRRRSAVPAADADAPASPEEETPNSQ